MSRNEKHVYFHLRTPIAFWTIWTTVYFKQYFANQTVTKIFVTEKLKLTKGPTRCSTTRPWWCSTTIRRPTAASSALMSSDRSTLAATGWRGWQWRSAEFSLSSPTQSASTFSQGKIYYSKSRLMWSQLMLTFVLCDQFVKDCEPVLQSTTKKVCSVNVIIWLLWADMLCPKVITFSGFHFLFHLFWALTSSLNYSA